jgi:hypothetical protein
MVRSSKNERLDLRISSKLKRQMKSWATRHNTSLSAVVTRFFENILQHEREERVSKEEKAAQKVL